MATQSPPHAKRAGRWIGRVLKTGLALVLILGAVLWIAGTVARANLVKANPAPGQRVDVGGFDMHMRCLGQGSPTVILDAGLHDFSVFWALVQPEVAEFSRVCAYDRAGYGWSEPSSDPRSSEMMVAELHRLLANANEAGPYVLVGHSFGGALAQATGTPYVQVRVDRRPSSNRAGSQLTYFVQARLEELDLAQRLPEYRNYMCEVSGFIPRLRQPSDREVQRPGLRS